jgi:glutathionylspermidine synthase
MEQVGWHPRRHIFTDQAERPIRNAFKLYPWEWMLREEFGRHLRKRTTRWIEPPWKMILSNKAILAILWELFPECPYLLRTEFESFDSTYVRKPIHGREGANITAVFDGQPIVETGGPYGDGPAVYQEFLPLPKFEGNFPVLGCWLVNGQACGMGIREDTHFITQNTSRFVPHVFR